MACAADHGSAEGSHELSAPQEATALIGVAPELALVQDVRSRLVAAGWLETSRQRKQRKVVREDGVTAVVLPIVPGVSKVELEAAGFTDVVRGALTCSLDRPTMHRSVRTLHSLSCARTLHDVGLGS
jgi:hypothetical protein